MPTALELLLQKTAGSQGAAPANRSSQGGTALGNLLTEIQTKKYQPAQNSYTAPPQVSDPTPAPAAPANKVTQFISQVNKLAQQLIPQLDPAKKVVAPQISREPITIVPKAGPNKPIDVSQFSPAQESNSAKLTPEAQKVAQENLEKFKKTKAGKAIKSVINVIDQVGQGLEKEKERVQRDLNTLARSGVASPAGFKDETVDTLPNYPDQQKDWDAKTGIVPAINRNLGLAMVGNIEGVSGGLIRADEVDPKTTDGKIVYAITKTLGSVYTMGKIGGAFDKIAAGSTTIGQFVDKYPKMAKIVLPWAKNVLAFDLYGQLDPELENRFQKLAIDTATGTLFSGLGSIKKGLISIPVNFAVGFGLAKKAGANNEDAFVAGGIMAALDAYQRGAKSLFETQLKTKSNNIRFTPEQAVEQVRTTNLKGTKAGLVIETAAAQAKMEGKDLQIDVRAYKQSSRAEDFLRAKTPRGIEFSVNLVDAAPQPARMAPGGEPAPAQGAAPSALSPAPVNPIRPTAESSGFAAAANQPSRPSAPIPPVPTTGNTSPIPQNPTAQDLALANKALNRKTATKTSADTLAGKREDLRLDDAETIRKTGTALKIENPTPESEVTIYRGGKGEIKPGDFVTTELAIAEKYIAERTDSKLFTNQVKAKDLVMSGGLKREFIYAPLDSVTITPQKDVKTFDYSSTQLDLPKEQASKIVEMANSIPEEALSKDPSDNYPAAQTGRESEPHITVLYGLSTTNQNEVKAIVEQSKPITVKLGKTSLFTNDKQDILKVDVNSPELTALNKQLDKALDTPGKTFKDYVPHVTVAYLKKGEGQKYAGDSRFEGDTLVLKDLTFSSKDGKKVTIPLAGKGESKVVTNKDLNEYYKSNENSEALGEAQYQVLAQLEVAQAGKRFATAEGEQVSYKSTFPQWMPEELRSRKLFDQVMSGVLDLSNITYPPNSMPRKQALYDAILDEIDSIAGLDSSDIRLQIKESNEKAKKESQEVANRSDERSQGTGKTKGVSNSATSKASREVFTEADARKREETINTTKIIEFPEMVKMVREITGEVPRVMKLREGLKGSFNPITQQIKLNRDLFSSEKQAARTLAHEIGHLVDFLAATGNTTKRGNLLGRLASLKGYRKHFISAKPPAEGDLITDADKKKLMKEARAEAKQEVEVTEEIEVGTKKITPKEILDVWRDTAVGIKNPELVKYIQTLTNRQKAEIARAAMNNTVLPWVNFMNSIKETVTRKVIKNAPADIKKIFKEKLQEEIAKRHLVSQAVIRDELKKLSFEWRPFDPKNSDKKHIAYRNSGEELYADAISVLFNDPLRLQQEAPVFYRTFFNYLDNKPQASEAFFDAYHLLNKGEDEVLASRLESIDKMFKNDEAKFSALQLERSQVKRDIGFQLKYELIDKNQKVLDKIKEAKKKGAIIPDDENPEYLLNGFNYVAGKIKAFLEEKINPWYSELADKGVSWDDVGKFMMLQRIISERTEIANPLGLTKSTAQPTLDKMKAELGAEKTKVIIEAITQFRAANKEVMEAAYKDGQLYDDKLYEQMASNEAYAAFRVTDYLDKNITAKIYKQVGTLKDIGNPATQTLAKIIATIRATERAKVNRSIVEFLKKNFEGEVELAKTRWNGKRQAAIEPTDGRGIIYVMEKGKAVGYYVDPFIASTVDSAGIQNANIILQGFALSNAKFFRPIFTGLNLGFQVRNFRRDFIRVYKTTPDLNPGKIIANYIRAMPAAKARALGNYNQTIIDMEKAGMMSVTYNDVIQGRTDDDKQIDDIFHRYLGNDKANAKNPIMRVAQKVFKPIEVAGNFIETLPKVAGYLQMSDRLSPGELGQFVRNRAGSPDFLRKGNSYGATNSIFLFSNAAKEGMRGDYEAFTDPKSRAGYWFKTFLIDILPKLLMKAAVLGAFGSQIKAMYDNISEYTKTNYTPIPLGFDENGKTIYLMTGSDEMGSLFGGLFWKAINVTNNKTLERGIMDIFSTAGANIPGVGPAITAVGAASQYVQGQNPYDNFRNRNILTDQQYQAGGKYAFIPFIKWEFQQLGGSILLGNSVLEQSTGNLSGFEKFLNTPVASNVLQSLVRVSDYGQVELNRAVAKEEQRKAAIQGIEDKKVISEAVKRVQEGADKNSVERDLVKKVLDEGKNMDTQARINKFRSQFRLAVVKGKDDPNIDSLISATSNKEKVAILKRLSESMPADKFEEFKREAIKNEVITPEIVVQLKNL